MLTYLNFLTPKILKMCYPILVTLIKMQPHNSQSSDTYIRTYIHTYIHTYILTYIHTYIHTYIGSLCFDFSIVECSIR